MQGVWDLSSSVLLVECSKKWLCSRENILEVSVSSSWTIALFSYSFDGTASDDALSFVLIKPAYLNFEGRTVVFLIILNLLNRFLGTVLQIVEKPLMQGIQAF
jgi:hypothetical protein